MLLNIQQTLLFDTCWSKNLIPMLLAAKYMRALAEPYPETTENIDRLFHAVHNEDYATISHLLTEKKVSSASVNYAKVHRPSLLIECCQRSNRKLLQLIIKIEKDQVKSSYEDADGHRATWYAIENDFMVGINDLLEHKLIDPNLHDTKTSFTPVLQCIQRKRSQVSSRQVAPGFVLQACSDSRSVDSSRCWRQFTTTKSGTSRSHTSDPRYYQWQRWNQSIPNQFFMQSQSEGRRW